MINLPIQCDTSNDAKKELNANPYIKILVCVSEVNLQENLDDICRLKIDSHQISFLVSVQQYLSIIDEIANE